MKKFFIFFIFFNSYLFEVQASVSAYEALQYVRNMIQSRIRYNQELIQRIDDTRLSPSQRILDISTIIGFKEDHIKKIEKELKNKPNLTSFLLKDQKKSLQTTIERYERSIRYLDFDFTSPAFYSILWDNFQSFCNTSQLFECNPTEFSKPEHKIKRLYLNLMMFLRLEESEIKIMGSDWDDVLGKLDVTQFSHYHEQETLHFLVKILKNYSGQWALFIDGVSYQIDESNRCFFKLEEGFNDFLVQKLFHHDTNLEVKPNTENLMQLLFSNELFNSESMEKLKEYLNFFQNRQNFHTQLSEFKKKTETLINSTSSSLLKAKAQEKEELLDHFSLRESILMLFESCLYFKPQPSSTTQPPFLVWNPPASEEDQSLETHNPPPPFDETPELPLSAAAPDTLFDPASLPLIETQLDSAVQDEDTSMWNEFLEEFKVYKKYQTQLATTPLAEDFAQPEETVTWEQLFHTVRKHHRGVLEKLFDQKNRPQLKFSDLQALVTTVGGVIRYSRHGSSHFRIILPKGIIAFSFRPHGTQHAKPYLWHQLTEFRNAFERLGLTPQKIHEWEEKQKKSTLP